MINIDRHQAGLLGPVTNLDTRGFVPSRVFGSMARAASTFARKFRAAQSTARMAEHYYSMSDASLARIGLTRDQIAAKLLRELMR